MDRNRFYPTADGLEPRVTPQVSPAQVVGAFVRAQTNTDTVQEVFDTFGKPRTQVAITALAQRLPQVAVESRADAAVLDQFRAELLAAAAADPARAATYRQYAGAVGAVQFEAQVSAAYADFFALGFGGTPVVPPPPPPPPPTPVNFGTDTRGPLPFPLDDPAFRTIENGVRIQDVTVGSGDEVSLGDEVNVGYTGYLRTTGAVFDSNPDAEFRAATSGLNSVIPGFANGLVGMRVGGVRRIDIPSSQAYGSAARPGIPANSDLVFEVTLISVN